MKKTVSTLIFEPRARGPLNPRIRPNPLLARLREISTPTDTVPAGFQTAQKWARDWGLHALTASKLLRDGVKAGVIVRKNFRVRLPDGRTYPTPHYAEK